MQTSFNDPHIPKHTCISCSYYFIYFLYQIHADKSKFCMTLLMTFCTLFYLFLLAWSQALEYVQCNSWCLSPLPPNMVTRHSHMSKMKNTNNGPTIPIHVATCQHSTFIYTYVFMTFIPQFIHYYLCIWRYIIYDELIRHIIHQNKHSY